MNNRLQARKAEFGERFRNVGSVLGIGTTFGDDVFLGMGSIIGDGTAIGNRVKVWHYSNIIGFAKIADDAMVASYVQLDPRVTIGRGSRIQNYCGIGTDSRIGERCFVGLYTLFSNAKYPPTQHLEPSSCGDDVIIGSHVLVNAGVKIGRGAIVDSGSIVTHDVPANEEWRGRPARFYRARKEFDEAKSLFENQVD